MNQQEVKTSQNKAFSLWPIVYASIFFLAVMMVSIPFSQLNLIPIELPLLICVISMGITVLFTHKALLAPYSILIAAASYLLLPESTINSFFIWTAITLTIITVVGFIVTRKTKVKVKISKKTKTQPVFEEVEMEAEEVSTEVASEEVSAPVEEITPVPAVSTAPFDEKIAAEGITIIFGTESGNCEDLANQAADSLKEDGHNVQVLDAEKVKVDYLASFANVLVITSTWGDGEPPSNATELMEKMQGGAKPDMSGSQFSVLALGDTSYEQFCKCGKDFDELLAGFGSSRFHDRVDCDLEFEDSYEGWITGVQASLKASGLKQKAAAAAPVA